jgi:hypothetical protein
LLNICANGYCTIVPFRTKFSYAVLYSVHDITLQASFDLLRVCANAAQVDLPEASNRKQKLASKLNMVPHGVR